MNKDLEVVNESKNTADGAFDLTSEAALINADIDASESLADQAILRAKSAGERLCRVKDQVGHGNWISWVMANIKKSPRQVRKYMQLYQNWNEIEAKTAVDGRFNLDNALRSLADNSDEVKAQEFRAEMHQVAAEADKNFKQLSKETPSKGKTAVGGVFGHHSRPYQQYPQYSTNNYGIRHPPRINLDKTKSLEDVDPKGYLTKCWTMFVRPYLNDQATKEEIAELLREFLEEII